MVGFEIPIIYSILAFLISTATRVTSYSSPQEVHSSLINHLDTVHAQLGTLSRSIRSVHSDISARQLDECQVMGPMSDGICSVLENENKLQEKTLLDDLIHNPLAQEKRTGSDTEDMEKRKLLIEDLKRKQELLQQILSSIEEARKSLQAESLILPIDALEPTKDFCTDKKREQNQVKFISLKRKRSCNVNLGFHCQTEHYSAVADMYNWLQSSLSPGKRRRRDVRENKH